MELLGNTLELMGNSAGTRLVGMGNFGSVWGACDTGSTWRSRKPAGGTPGGFPGFPFGCKDALMEDISAVKSINGKFGKGKKMGEVIWSKIFPDGVMSLARWP